MNTSGHSPQELLRASHSREILHTLAVYMGLGVIIVIIILLSAHFFMSTERESPFIGDNGVAARGAVLEEWVSTFGSATDLAIFRSIGERLVVGAEQLGSTDSGQTSFVERLFDRLFLGLLHVTFVIIALWRPAVLFALILFFEIMAKEKPYAGSDLLGILGNGRLFFSGLLVRLGGPNRDEPHLCVPSLVAPPLSTENEAKRTAFAVVLQSVSTLTNTNLYLLRVLTRLSKSNRQSSDSSLAIDVKVQAAFEAVVFAQQILAKEKEFSVPSVSLARESLSADAYREYIASLLFKCLTPSLRSAFVAIPTTQLATFLMSLGIGYEYARGGADQAGATQSSFPERVARAVFYSSPDLSQDYTPRERDILRRGILLSRLDSNEPTIADLVPEILALRTIGALFLSPVSELASFSDDLEILNIIVEEKGAVQKAIGEFLGKDFKTISEHSLMSRSVIFLPITPLLAKLRAAVTPRSLNRLHVLVSALHQKKKLTLQSLEEVERVKMKRTIDHIAPLSISEVKALASAFKLSADAVHDWSSLRCLLSMIGYLPTRVHEQETPPEYLLFVATEVGKRKRGIQGVVPLRRACLTTRENDFLDRNCTLVRTLLLCGSPEELREKVASDEPLIPEGS